MEEKNTVRGRFWLQRTGSEPGLAFFHKHIIDTGLKPIRLGRKWRVPIVTKWTVFNTWDRESFLAVFVVAAFGEYERRYELTYKREADPGNWDIGDNVQQLSELGDTIAWTVGEDEETPILPDMEVEWFEEHLAIWVTSPLEIRASITQVVPSPGVGQGYFMPQGWVNWQIVYHWKTVDIYEFEARRRPY